MAGIRVAYIHTQMTKVQTISANIGVRIDALMRSSSSIEMFSTLPVPGRLPENEVGFKGGGDRRGGSCARTSPRPSPRRRGIEGWRIHWRRPHPGPLLGGE